jgi:hypothetical protein
MRFFSDLRAALLLRLLQARAPRIHAELLIAILSITFYVAIFIFFGCILGGWMFSLIP